MRAGSKKPSPTARLQAEVPAGSGTQWEKRSGGGEVGKSAGPSLVKEADCARRQQRLLAARGRKATFDEVGVREQDALQALRSQTTAENKRAEVCRPARRGSRTRGERIRENQGRGGIPFSMVLSLSWLHPLGEQSAEICALPGKRVTHISTTMCIGSVPETSQDPETRLSGVSPEGLCAGPQAPRPSPSLTPSLSGGTAGLATFSVSLSRSALRRRTQCWPWCPSCGRPFTPH